MSDEWEKLQFGGTVQQIAEELGASMSKDQDRRFMEKLHEDFLAAGKPKNRKAWIREQLNKCFVYVDKRPEWVESLVPLWPFHDGKPMTFIGQIDVPENAPKSNVFPGTVVYVFGVRKEGSEGSEMVYEVIHQHRSLGKAE
jgi:hypothetical protein